MRILDFDKYQMEASSFALPTALRMEYLIPGLAAEAGEVAGLYAKKVRDGLTKDYHEKLHKELGDCLWFLATICEMENWDLRDVAEKNLSKLYDRQKRGVLGGSGDNR